MTPTPTISPTTSPQNPVNPNPRETVTRFDVPRGYDRFLVELEPDPRVEAYSFALRDGDVHHDDAVSFDSTEITYTGKYYIEIHPDDSVDVDVAVMYDHDNERTHAVDTTVTLHDTNEMWIALRGGPSSFGIVR